MTTGILNSINTKDGLYKTLRKTDTNTGDYQVAKANLKRYREILRNSIKKAKMLYYKRTFNIYQKDVKKTWALIKETLQQKKKQELPTELICNDQPKNTKKVNFKTYEGITPKKLTLKHTKE